MLSTTVRRAAALLRSAAPVRKARATNASLGAKTPALLFGSRAVACTVAAAGVVTAFSTATVAAAGKDAASGSGSVSKAVTKVARKPKVIFVLGGPGAGKGTQCGLVVEKYGFVHLSAGDLLRAERNSGSPDGDLIQSYIKDGRIVPVEITVNLIKKAMAASGAQLFLVDGFPRNFDNLQGWHKVMGDEAEVEFVLFYDTDEARMEQRILKRSETSGRTDDNLATIKKRFRTFVESTMPVVDVYAKQGRVRRISSSASVEEVFEDTKRVVEPIVEAEILSLNQELLDSITTGDSVTYTKLCADDLTAFEGEAAGQLVSGLDFHNTYLDNAPVFASPVKNHMASPKVRLLGDTAIVTYTRLVQTLSSTNAFNETRVWQRNGSRWSHVHFHRSPAGSS